MKPFSLPKKLLSTSKQAFAGPVATVPALKNANGERRLALFRHLSSLDQLGFLGSARDGGAGDSFAAVAEIFKKRIGHRSDLALGARRFLLSRQSKGVVLGGVCIEALFPKESKRWLALMAAEGENVFRALFAPNMPDCLGEEERRGRLFF